MKEALPRRTPVLVGVGAVSQHESDPARAREPYALMVEALRRAAEDAGAPRLLHAVDRVLVPQGFWSYPDPGRLVASAIGANGARTLFAEVGVLQTTLLGEAAREIAEGTASVIAVTGGEAKFRSLRAQTTGCDDSLTQQPDGTTPDRTLKPTNDIVHPLEIERNIPMPITQFAIIENALRHAQGLSVDAHRAVLGELWASFSRVAASNPLAWSPTPRTAQEIVTPSEQNRMLAFPYTKLQSSGWNVDQAAGLVFCSVEMAERMSIPPNRWIFPLGVVDSNHMVTLSERAHVHRCPGFQVAGRRLSEHCGIPLEKVDFLELYSCFPAAVRLQIRELGLSDIAASRALTQTGGMTFAGGPLNNFVFQALVRMADTLRAASGSTGLVTALSGTAVKQGVSLWAARPPRAPFRHEDVSAEAEKATPRVTVAGNRHGAGTIAAYTVQHERGRPTRGVALVDFPSGERNIAFTDDPDAIGRMMVEDLCERRVNVDETAKMSL